MQGVHGTIFTLDFGLTMQKCSPSQAEGWQVVSNTVPGLCLFHKSELRRAAQTSGMDCVGGPKCFHYSRQHVQELFPAVAACALSFEAGVAVCEVTSMRPKTGMFGDLVTLKIKWEQEEWAMVFARVRGASR